MQSMTDLIYRPLLRNQQLAVRAQGGLFEEIVNLITRAEEIPVTDVGFFTLLVGGGDEFGQGVVFKGEGGDE